MNLSAGYIGTVRKFANLSGYLWNLIASKYGGFVNCGPLPAVIVEPWCPKCTHTRLPANDEPIRRLYWNGKEICQFEWLLVEPNCIQIWWICQLWPFASGYSRTMVPQMHPHAFACKR